MGTTSCVSEHRSGTDGDPTRQLGRAVEAAIGSGTVRERLPGGAFYLRREFADAARAAAGSRGVDLLDIFAADTRARGYSTLENEEIAQLIGTSDDTVYRALRELVAAGVLAVRYVTITGQWTRRVVVVADLLHTEDGPQFVEPLILTTPDAEIIIDAEAKPRKAGDAPRRFPRRFKVSDLEERDGMRHRPTAAAAVQCTAPVRYIERPMHRTGADLLRARAQISEETSERGGAETAHVACAPSAVATLSESDRTPDPGPFPLALWRAPWVPSIPAAPAPQLAAAVDVVPNVSSLVVVDAPADLVPGPAIATAPADDATPAAVEAAVDRPSAGARAPYGSDRPAKKAPQKIGPKMPARREPTTAAVMPKAKSTPKPKADPSTTPATGDQARQWARRLVLDVYAREYRRRFERDAEKPNGTVRGQALALVLAIVASNQGATVADVADVALEVIRATFAEDRTAERITAGKVGPWAAILANDSRGARIANAWRIVRDRQITATQSAYVASLPSSPTPNTGPVELSAEARASMRNFDRRMRAIRAKSKKAGAA